MGAFKYNNPVIRVLIKIANLILVSLYWALTCIPIVTIITSTSAMYYTVAKVVNGSGDGVTRSFFGAFKENFKKGILLSLLVAGSGVILFFDLYFGYANYGKSSFAMVYFFIGVPLAILWLALVLYLPVVFARFDGTLGVILQLTAYFSSRNLVRTILMILVLAVVVFLVDYYPILLLLLPGLYMDIFRGSWERMIKKYLDQNGYTEPESAEAQEEEQPAELSATEWDELFRKKD